MKKKICFIVSYPGNATAFLKDHILALQETFEVHLVANFSNEECMANFNWVKWHNIKIERKIHLWRDLNALIRLGNLFKKEAFYSVHSVTPKAGLLTAIGGFLAHVPHRIHIFTGQVWCTMPKSFKRSLLISIDKIIVKLDTNVLVDSKPQCRFLIDNKILNEKKSYVIGHGSICGVNLNRFEPDLKIRKKIRNVNNITDERVVFILIGRMNHDKGIGELFIAFNKLVPKCPLAYLILVGNDEDGYDKKVNQYPYIKRNENYKYYSYTQRPQDMLQAADVFVLPTWREGFGSSVIEASCVGIPVICSDAYGVIDAMVDNKTGLRCHVGDPNSLYICMKRMYDDKFLRKEMGLNGRKRVIEKFSGELITKAWVDFYKRL